MAAEGSGNLTPLNVIPIQKFQQAAASDDYLKLSKIQKALLTYHIKYRDTHTHTHDSMIAFHIPLKGAMLHNK